MSGKLTVFNFFEVSQIPNIATVDETIDESIHDRSTFSSKMCALIEDVREVRAELARLKNVPFFRGDDDAAR